MRSLASFDEIHAMALNMIENYSEEEIIEHILNILRMAYIRGKRKAAEELQWDWTDYYLLKWDEWEEQVILKKFDDKNVVDRIKEYYQNKDSQKLAVVIDTEYHRDYNTGEEDMATYIDERSVVRVKKTWRTQLDDKVRDTHDYLEGKQVYLDEKFYTYDGDEARFPGDFNLAENNINCRCYVEYKR